MTENTEPGHATIERATGRTAGEGGLPVKSAMIQAFTDDPRDVVRCLGLGGHLLVYGTLSDGPMCIPSRDLMMPVAKVSGFDLGNWLSQQPLLRMLRVLRAVRKLGAEGVFRADVARVYPLDDVAQAVAAAMGPGRTGKILLSIDSRRPQ
jgi:NADPH:quinone reductase-like Zn-dependent oxidoreductase